MANSGPREKHRRHQSGDNGYLPPVPSRGLSHGQGPDLRKRRSLLHHFSHGRGKSIPPLGYRFDHLRPIFSVAQGFSEIRDVLSQGAVLDKNAGPKLSPKLVLGDQPAFSLQKKEGGFEYFGRKSDGPPAGLQALLGWIHPKVAELVDGLHS